MFLSKRKEGPQLSSVQKAGGLTRAKSQTKKATV